MELQIDDSILVQEYLAGDESLKKAAGVKSGSGRPNTEKVGYRGD